MAAISSSDWSLGKVVVFGFTGSVASSCATIDASAASAGGSGGRCTVCDDVCEVASAAMTHPAQSKAGVLIGISMSPMMEAATVLAAEQPFRRQGLLIMRRILRARAPIGEA